MYLALARQAKVINMRQGNIVLTISRSPIANINSSFNTDAVNLISAYAYSIQLTWASGSTPVGTFTLQGSNDSGDASPGQGTVQPINFTTISGSSQAISGNTGSILYDVPQCSYRWVRLVYTSNSGTATVTAANINVKGV